MPESVYKSISNWSARAAPEVMGEDEEAAEVRGRKPKVKPCEDCGDRREVAELDLQIEGGSGSRPIEQVKVCSSKRNERRATISAPIG